MGVPVSGSKAVLIQRILDHQAEATAEDADGEVAVPEAIKKVELEDLTAVQLKDLCRQKGLAVSGAKAVLIKRLLEHQAEGVREDVEERVEQEEPAEPEEPDEPEKELEEVAEVSEEQLPKKNALDLLTEALESDNIDDIPVEELLNLKVPAPGEIVEGTVMSLVEWGAFVELDSGWSALLHISEITDAYVDNIEDFLHPGQKVTAMVIENKDGRGDRLSLSMRRVEWPVNIREVVADSSTGTLPVQTEGPRSASTPTGKRLESMEEATLSLEARISALEAVLAQLGHGEALRSAQKDAREGLKRAAVPSIQSILSSIPEDRVYPETRRERVSQDFEREAIEKVLEDLESGPTFEESSPQALASGALEPTRLAGAEEVLRDLELREAQRGRSRLNGGTFQSPSFSADF